MTQTTKCIRCNRQAEIWTGHVRKRNGKTVLAGWCSKKCMYAWQAYHGSFLKKYGEETA